jgi:hypothetical protein
VQPGTIPDGRLMGVAMADPAASITREIAGAAASSAFASSQGSTSATVASTTGTATLVVPVTNRWSSLARRLAPSRSSRTTWPSSSARATIRRDARRG